MPEIAIKAKPGHHAPKAPLPAAQCSCAERKTRLNLPTEGEFVIFSSIAKTPLARGENVCQLFSQKKISTSPVSFCCGIKRNGLAAQNSQVERWKTKFTLVDQRTDR
jgi:hypothetical protein